MNFTLKNGTKNPETVMVSGFFRTDIFFGSQCWLREEDSNFRPLGSSHKRCAFACPLAVPGVWRRLPLFAALRRPLRQTLLPSSATGGGRRLCPTSSARRPHNPKTVAQTLSHTENEKRHPTGCLFSFWLVAPKKISRLKLTNKLEFCALFL